MRRPWTFETTNMPPWRLSLRGGDCAAIYLRERAPNRLAQAIQLPGILSDDEAVEVEHRIAEAWATWKTTSE
jgi:hypothetical protein